MSDLIKVPRIAKPRKTIKREDLPRLQFCNSNKLLKPIEMDGTRYQWVGIGFVNEGKPHGTETLIVD